MFLNLVSLGVILVTLVAATAGIVVLGSLPGRIAREREHPWAAAVNVASWIGLATAFLWPVALIWAFLPLPYRREGNDSGDRGDGESVVALQKRLAQLEESVARLQSDEASA